jgi:DNA-binding response OmpR family regulator
MILKAILAKWGYEVVETANGDEAWQVLQKDDAPRLAIVDWVMPGMSGELICRKLRETEPPHPTYIILLTSKRDKEDIVRGLDAGANDYIRKPFDRPELQARVKVGERVLQLESALEDRVRVLEGVLARTQSLEGVLEKHLAVYDEMNRHIGFIEAILEGFSEHFAREPGTFNKKLESLSRDASARLENLKDLIARMMNI